MFDPTDRGQFLNMAAFFEGGLVAAAFVLGWLVGTDPLETLSWKWTAAALGLAGVVPMFALFLLSQRFPVGPLLRIKRFLVEMLGPSLSVCTWYDLILLAALAGVGEEMLFRGVLQQQTWLGLVGSNVLFGLAHLITPLYAVLAGVIGVYLGMLMEAPGEPNLLVPMITHAVYDYLAFLVVVRDYRAEQRARQERPAENQDAFKDDDPEN